MNTADVETAVSGLSSKANVVAVKMGSAGGMAAAGEKVEKAPAIPVVVVDTVGAGDTFDAGFVYGFLAGWPLLKTLKLGIACGSLSTQKPGGLEGQPRLAQALEAIS
jgi:sugar/nucleoside kinase (ribokinase family)